MTNLGTLINISTIYLKENYLKMNSFAKLTDTHSICVAYLLKEKSCGNSAA